MRLSHIFAVLASAASLKTAAAYKKDNVCAQCIDRCPVPNYRPYMWTNVCSWCINSIPCRQLYHDHGLLPPEWMPGGGVHPAQRDSYQPRSGLKPIDGSYPDIEIEEDAPPTNSTA
ncbi:hypothetical protein CkaCkLH20_06568 [Colletotrichum karsti]|uniref:Uncharacterized protein n=1 Tax=Colletotrichum karsti TaxID=1095194 RepID=A0A9P6LL25_9PEZI|nr:uncharacterized protein CkaCkLH20_06568 [Colletotrichum karsti]KAF9876122.1 hypothetical protein CkaCkLH20_06568 [Colletotrichum karsti]